MQLGKNHGQGKWLVNSLALRVRQTWYTCTATELNFSMDV